MKLRSTLWKTALQLVVVFVAVWMLVVAIPMGSASAGDGGDGVIDIVLLRAKKRVLYASWRRFQGV